MVMEGARHLFCIAGPFLRTVPEKMRKIKNTSIRRICTDRTSSRRTSWHSSVMKCRFVILFETRIKSSRGSGEPAYAHSRRQGTGDFSKYLFPSEAATRQDDGSEAFPSCLRLELSNDLFTVYAQYLTGSQPEQRNVAFKDVFVEGKWDAEV